MSQFPGDFSFSQTASQGNIQSLTPPPKLFKWNPMLCHIHVLFLQICSFQFRAIPSPGCTSRQGANM